MHGQNMKIAQYDALMQEYSRATEILNEYQSKLESFRQQVALGSSTEVSQALKNDQRYQELENLMLQYSIEQMVQAERGPQSQWSL